MLWRAQHKPYITESQPACPECRGGHGILAS